MSGDNLLNNLRGMASPTAELAADRIETLEAEVAKIQRALGTRAIFAGCATDEDKVDAMGREIAHLERLAAGYCAEVDQCHEEAVTFQAEIVSLRAALEEAQRLRDLYRHDWRTANDALADTLDKLAEAQRVADLRDGFLLSCPWCGLRMGKGAVAHIRHLIDCGDRRNAECLAEVAALKAQGVCETAQDGGKTTVAITAVWLRRIGDYAQVLVEVGGKWRLAIREHAEGSYSHIAEGRGANHWPVDVAPVAPTPEG